MIMNNRRIITLFKNADKRLKELGFNKIDETGHGARYERFVSKYSYIQCLDLSTKGSGYHLVQSYQKDINKDKLNNCVGLTMYETKLVFKKMKELGWKSKK